MGRLQTKVAECEYREYDRLLIEQFIDRLNDEGMNNEILMEVTTLENIEEATSKYFLNWVHRVEMQRAQRSALNSIMESKDFGSLWQNTQ